MQRCDIHADYGRSNQHHEHNIAGPSKRGAAGEEDGPLVGDPYVMLLRRQLRNYTTTPVSGLQIH